MGRRNVTQVQMALALGRTQAAVSRRLTGRVAFDVEELSAVAVVLDTTVAHLMTGLDTESVA